MSSDHTLTIYFDGDEVVPVFRCTAKPSASGQPPACWTYLDEEGEFRVGDHCNAYEWIKHVGPYFLEREITLEVEVDWDDEAPQVVVSDPAKRIAELEAELAKFKECENGICRDARGIVCVGEPMVDNQGREIATTRTVWHKEGE